MFFRPLRLFLSGLLLCAFGSLRLSAQTTTSGGLTGVVTDPSRAVVPDALVELIDDTKGTIQSAKTDSYGAYRFFFLAPGVYFLIVSHVNFQAERREVHVLLGPPVTVNFTLQIAKKNTTLKVTAEAPLIQAENGDASTTTNQQQISEVPNPGNDLTYIVQTAPGVLMNIDGGPGFSILGMPSTSYLFTIDGVNSNENGENTAIGGLLGVLLGQNQIQAATIVTTGYSGQFGGAAGGNINYITKSGSKEFHGNAQYYWNGRVFNANDWFSNASESPRPFDIANQWAGSLGGPIQKDKLFFFFDTEGLRLLVPQIFQVVIPSTQFENATIANIDSAVTSAGKLRFGPTSATHDFYEKIFSLYNAALGASSATPGGVTPDDPSGCNGFTRLGTDPITGMQIPCARHFVLTRSRSSQETLVSGRIDWNVSQSDRAFLHLQFNGARSSRYNDPINSVFDTDASGPWWQGEISETHTFSSSAASQFLVAGSYRDFIQQPKDPAQALAAFPSTLTFNAGSSPNAFATLGGIDNAYVFGFSRADTQYQLSEDVMKTLGKQKFGLGASFVRIHWTILSNKVNATGILTPQTLDAFYQGGVDPASPTVDVTQLSQSFASGSNRIGFYEFGLYGQDEWQARPNLTLTMSLRAEHQSNPICANHCFARLAGPFESISRDPAEPYNQGIFINQRQGLPSIDPIVWSPRFSFAWQPFGASRSSVLRGGIGIFYDSIEGYPATSASNNPPLYNAFTVSGDNLSPNEKTNLFTFAANSNAGFVNGFAAGKNLAQIQALDPNFFPPSIIGWKGQAHLPQYQRWSLEWQQGLGVGTSLSIGYFGHHGIHELVEDPDANAYCNPAVVALPSGAANPCFGFTSTLPLSVPDPRFSGVTELSSVAVSNYNGMVISFQHRFSRWSQGLFQANYTYSLAFDEVSNGGDFFFNGGGDSLSPQDPNNLRGAYGPAEYDVRHSFNASYVWELPLQVVLRSHGSDSLAKGWQVSGTIFARSGEPYTILDFAESQTLQQNNYFGMLYAVPVGPPGPAASCGEGAAIPLATRPCLPPQLVNGSPNPNALFVQSGCETGFNTGTLGPSGSCAGGPAVSFAQGRNRFRGPSYFNTDFAITKFTKIPRWENAVLGIGFQFFNFFNHPNFGPPDNFLSNSTFGQISFLEQPPTGILGSGAPARMIQLKAQLKF
jgi:hypothetical protein